jgi:peptidoglycan/xylan/chitin deacetylase (PgdA/CDA1 family)
MTYDPDRLLRRREDRRAAMRRRRLGAVAALLGVVAAVVLAVVVIGSIGGASSGSASKPKASTQTESGSDAEKNVDWKSPLATPAAQAAAIDRVVKVGKPVYCAGGRNGRYIALTFDDGPGLYTHFALRYLKKWQMHSTFFLIGRLLADPSFRELARKENTLVGAATGNHSWTHPYLPGLGIGEVQTQLADTKRAAEAASGSEVKVFRPPYGARTDAIDKVSSRQGMAQIIWDIDSRDSQGANYAEIARIVISQMKPGSIILLHENRGQTIRALRQILPAVRKKNLTPVTVPELLALDPPSDAQLQAGPDGCGNLRGKSGAVRAGA